MRTIAIIIFYVITLITTLLGILVMAIVLLFTFPFDRQRKTIHTISYIWAKFVFAIAPGWRVKWEGLENINHKEPCVIIANHQSMLDIPLIELVPMNYKWVSKKEVVKLPIFGWVMKMHGDITFERGATGGAKKMITACVKYLNHGVSITIFPEGTRSKNGTIGRFKEGAFEVAKLAQCPIIQLVTDGTFDAVDGWKIKSPHKFTIKVLPPISAQEVAQTDVKDLAKICELRAKKEHQTMHHEFYK